MSSLLNYKQYISPEGEQGVRNFQYKGGSDSFLYTHLWSPLSQFIVTKCMPSYVAPNTITVFATLQLVIVHIITVSYTPDFQTELPSWVLVMNGISVLIYQILDNVDGKQARETQTSSPLGMLFDHGCDSVTSWIMGISMICSLKLGQTTLSYFSLIIISQIAFFSAQWSQYHVGIFRLGFINAIDEGLVLAELLVFYTAYMGQGVWTVQIESLNLTTGQLAMILFLLTSFFQILQFMRDTWQAVEFNGEVAATLVCCFFHFGCYLLAYFIGGQELILNYGIYIHYIFAPQFSKVTLQIQLAFITKEKFRQFPKSFLIVPLLFFIVKQTLLTTRTNNDKELITVFIIFSLSLYLFTVFCICIHMSQILGIHIFSTKKRQLLKGDTELQDADAL